MIARDVDRGRQALRRIEAARIALLCRAELENDALPLLEGHRCIQAKRELEFIIRKLRDFEARNGQGIRPDSVKAQQRLLTRGK